MTAVRTFEVPMKWRSHAHPNGIGNGKRLHFHIPAAGERLPRRLQSLDGEVTEIRLEQLLFVVAEFHVEIAVECARLIFFGRLNQFIDALNTNTRNQKKNEQKTKRTDASAMAYSVHT